MTSRSITAATRSTTFASAAAARRNSETSVSARRSIGVRLYRGKSRAAARARSVLEKERREQRAVGLFQRARYRLVFIVVVVRDLELGAFRDRRRDADVEVVERIAEIVGLPEAGDLLRQLARRRNGPIEI